MVPNPIVEPNKKDSNNDDQISSEVSPPDQREKDTSVKQVPETQEVTEAITQEAKLLKTDTLAASIPSIINVFEIVSKQRLNELSSSPNLIRDAFRFEENAHSISFQFQPRDTPFLVLSNIPRFFELKVFKNENQNPNQSTVKIHTDLESVPQILDAHAMFNESTMTVRVVPLSTVNGMTIEDPNVITPGAVKVYEVESLYSNYQSWASLIETRLMHLIKVFQATDSILHTIPSRKTVNRIHGQSSLHSALSSMSFFTDDYPHIYLSAFFSGTPWYIDALDALYQNYPMYLGKADVTSWQNMEMMATIRCVTDQFSAAVANLQMQRLMESQLNIEDYINRCKANMFEHDTINVRTIYNENVTNLLYSPSKIEWNLVMALIMCNRAVRESLFSSYVSFLTPTNRLTLYSLEDVWNAQNGPSDPIGNQIYNTFLQRMAVGDDQSPYRLLLLETFCPWFEIRLKFPSLPSDFGAIIEIMSILFFVNTFPQLANNSVNQWSYRLNELLTVYMPRQHLAWQQAYGETRYKGQAQVLHGRQLTRSMSQQGIIYSFLDQVPNRVPAVDAKYYNLMSRIREMCTPLIHENLLRRKRLAGYPYYATDYLAFMSWQPVDVQGLAGQPQTDWVRRLLSIVDLVEEITKMRSSSVLGRDSLQRSTLTWLNIYFSNLRQLLRSSSLPFQSTMYRMQDLLCNSFAYVYQRYTPHTPFIIPSDLILAPADLFGGDMGVPIRSTKVLDFEIFSAFRFLLTLEGDFKRNITLTTRGTTHTTDSLPQPSQNFLIVQGADVDRLAMGLLSPARRFGVAMQIQKWLCDPDDPENPIRTVAQSFQLIMRMSNWVPLMRRIFEVFGLSFEDYYVDSFNPGSGVFDGRKLILQIHELDPVSQKPQKRTRPGTIFGNELKYVDNWTYQHFRILTVPFLDEASPILNTIQGTYIGRFIVTELLPQHPDLEAGWTLIPASTIIDQTRYQLVQWSQTPVKDGYAHVLRIATPQSPNVFSTYYLPYDVTMPKLMIVLDTFSQIPISHKEVTAKAVHFGSLAFKVLKSRMSVTIVDAPSRTFDYSEEQTISEIQRLISTPDGQLVGQTMLTTAYATNFTHNAKTIPYYIQWSSSIAKADKNLFAAVLNSGSAAKDQTVLPSGHELEYGQRHDGISLAFSSGNVKINSPLVNWNNEYRAISDHLLKMPIELEYVPSQPMSYDAFSY